jgi:hypothetical protein
MNIFLDKSLPKRTQVLLQILRAVLLIIIFGGLFYATINPAVGDIVLDVSIGLAVIFLTIRIVIARKEKNLAEKNQLNNVTESTASNLREKAANWKQRR